MGLHPEDVRLVINAARFFGRELDERPRNELLRGNDEDRITWSHPRHAFKVYRVAIGMMRTQCKVFKVERRGRAGILLSRPAMQLESSRVICLARKYWNAADESDGMRYPENLLFPISLD